VDPQQAGASDDVAHQAAGQAVAIADDQPAVVVERQPAGAGDALCDRDRLSIRPIQAQHRATSGSVPGLAGDEQPSTVVDDGRLEHPQR
jgi:hypothetical protein